jgi:hypothetical protein
MNTQFFVKTVQTKGKLMLDWRNWIYGLMSGFIGGAASAGLAALGAATASGLGMDVKSLDWKQFGIILLTSGMVSAFAFLKQSPLPAKDAEAGPANNSKPG